MNLTRARFSAFRTENDLRLHRGRALRAARSPSAAAASRPWRSRASDSQIRSYPASHGGHVAQAGYEHFLALDLPGHAPRVADGGGGAAARAGLPAGPHHARPGRRAARPPGPRVGRPRGGARPRARPRGLLRRHELRARRTAIGSLRFGSELVNVTADATDAGRARQLPLGRRGRGGPAGADRARRRAAPASCPRARRAAEIGLDRSGGCMRAEGFARQPIVRMTNVNLEPGDGRHARRPDRRHRRRPLIETNRSWSIDNRRLHFQFEGEAAWEISGGERGRLLRNPSYAGVTPEFWGSCDAVCSRARVAADLAARLRQGRARPGDARLARRRAGALPRRRGRAWRERPLELAERALAARAGPGRARARHARALADAALRREPAHAGHRRSTT